MLIKFNARVFTGGRAYTAGQVADLRLPDARPLIDTGAAEEYEEDKPEIVPEVDVLLATNVDNLDEMLAHIDDADVIAEAAEIDHRSTAEPKYRARLEELEGED